MPAKEPFFRPVANLSEKKKAPISQLDDAVEEI